MEQQYAAHLSDFTNWNQAEHAEACLPFAHNFGEYLSIDETSFSQGEIYTILNNKAAKGNKAALVAIIKGTKSESVIKFLIKIKELARKNVKKVSLELAPTMTKIVK